MALVWTPIRESQLVRAIAYDPAAERIYVQLASDLIQHFDDCDVQEWTRFNAAHSKGEYLTRVLHHHPHQGTGLRAVVPRPSRPGGATRADYLNAFRPAQEMYDPFGFAGRESQVREIADALLSEGSCILIYGQRGLGKSSLAVQAQLMAMGDGQLLALMGSPELAIPDDRTFLTLFVSCSDSVPTTDELVQRLINAAEEVVPASDEEPSSRLVDRTTKRGVSIKFFNAEVTKTFAASRARTDFTSLAPVERLQRVIRLLNEGYGQPVLLVIDELDRVADKSGLASLVRNLSGPDVKFLLVGIAEDWSTLLLDHRSVERIIVPIRLPLMRRPELAQIIDLAVDSLLTTGTPVGFDDDARTRIVEVASGFPWFVHVLGQASLMACIDGGSHYVRGDDVVRTLRMLVTQRYAENYEQKFRQAVGDDHDREVVLRLLADWPTIDPSRLAIVESLASRGIVEPNQVLRDLASETHGEVILFVQDSHGDRIRFRDGMFRAYVFLRQP